MSHSWEKRVEMKKENFWKCKKDESYFVKRQKQQKSVKSHYDFNENVVSKNDLYFTLTNANKNQIIFSDNNFIQ